MEERNKGAKVLLLLHALILEGKSPLLPLTILVALIASLYSFIVAFLWWTLFLGEWCPQKMCEGVWHCFGEGGRKIQIKGHIKQKTRLPMELMGNVVIGPQGNGVWWGWSWKCVAHFANEWIRNDDEVCRAAVLIAIAKFPIAFPFTFPPFALNIECFPNYYSKKSFNSPSYNKFLVFDFKDP